MYKCNEVQKIHYKWFHFHTKDKYTNVKLQNNNVFMKGNTSEAEYVNYYGYILDIIEITYISTLIFVLFKCEQFYTIGSC